MTSIAKTKDITSNNTKHKILKGLNKVLFGDLDKFVVADINKDIGKSEIKINKQSKSRDTNQVVDKTCNKMVRTVKADKTVEADKIAKAEKKKRDAELEKDRTQLIKNWKWIMAHSKKYNYNFDTFEIINESKTSYGWWFQILAPYGLSFDELEGLKPKIESNMGCKFMYEIHSSNRFTTCKLIYESLVKCNDILFEPVKVEPYEVCPGVTESGEPIIINLNVAPHVLIAGQTRKGKNGSADSIILSWLNSCTEEDIELYLFQCSKVDLIKYRDCRHVKCFVLGDFEKMLIALKHIVNTEIKIRLSLFENMFKQRRGENIYDYNKINKNNKLPYIYVIIDEFLELMLQSKSMKEENKIKDEILAYIQKIGQMGASVGIHYIILHQKPEMKLCPTFIKNMSSVRVCFGFDDESCGRIVLGDKDGGLILGLPPRRAYINSNGALRMLYTTNLEGRRDMYIKPHEVKNKKDFFNSIKTDVATINSITSADIDKVRKNIKDNVGTFIVKTSKDSNCDNTGKVKLPIYLKDRARVIKKIQSSDDLREYNTHETLHSKDEIEINNTNEIVCEEVNNEEYNEKTCRACKDRNNMGSDTDTRNGLQNIHKRIKLDRTDKFNGNEISDIIDKIVEENTKRIPGWVPYVPAKGDKIPDITNVRLIGR